jgi:serine/threonine-protein kinase
MNGMSASRAAIAADPPPIVGSYVLLTKLARGGMATVYVGNKYGVAGFERLVAVKCCHPHLREDELFVTMFFDEARLAARIHHPNVVPTLDVGCTDVLYLVMDYVEGGSLKALFRRATHSGKKLPLEVAVRVLVDALAGLHAAHELCGNDGELFHLVHRDVSPQNVLVGIDGISRITDFGIAFAAARSTVIPDGKIIGKLSYMAPEQLSGQRVTRRIDVFAAGTVLWEALTGRPLFRREDDASTINAVLVAEVPPPSSITPGLPPALDAIVLKALERDPDDRYQTAAEFADALEELPIELASNRAVAAYVEGVLGSVIAERRARIRAAAEQGEQRSETDSVNSDVREKLLLAGAGTSTLSDDDRAADPDVDPSGVRIEPLMSTAPTAPSPQPAATPDEIEHRRMRSLLAAAMLLLVGSAVGLLLARSSGESSAAPASPPANMPNSVGSVLPVRSPTSGRVPSP